MCYHAKVWLSVFFFLTVTIQCDLGVIFALKMLTTDLLPANVMVMGIFPVPSRWACWVELIVIQLMVPNASFVGNVLCFINMHNLISLLVLACIKFLLDKRVLLQVTWLAFLLD